MQRSVGTRGLEPPRIAPYASETYAYTNSATCPWVQLKTKKGDIAIARDSEAPLRLELAALCERSLRQTERIERIAPLVVDPQDEDYESDEGDPADGLQPSRMPPKPISEPSVTAASIRWNESVHLFPFKLRRL